MKKLLLIMVAILATANAWAYDFSAVAPSGQTLYYNISGSNVMVTYQNNYSYSTYPTGNLTIPSIVTYNGTTYSVTSIGEYAFSACRGLTSVTIPNSVTSIGYCAFYGCSGLTSVTIGNSVTNIGEFAFRDCSGLTSVTIGNSVTSIADYTFCECSGLTSVTIGNSVTSIGDYAFRGCGGLTSVTIPNSVTSIGHGAFNDCIGLTSVTVESLVPPTLGNNAFGSNAYNRMFYVPCSALDTYLNSVSWSWYYYNIAAQIVDIEVTVTADQSRGNAVIVPIHGVAVSCDSTVIVEATPHYGYHFDHWSTGSTQAIDTLQLHGDTIITAFFAPNEYLLSLNTNDAQEGIVNGAGVFHYGDTITISAVPAEHHHLVFWNDGEVDEVRQIVIEGDTTFTAIFAIDTVHVEILSNDIAWGQVTGSGDYAYGDMVTATATAYSGYKFYQWDNGNAHNPYTFAALSDTTNTAIFVDENWEGIEDAATPFSIHVQGTSISIEGVEGQIVRVYDMSGRLLECDQNTQGKLFQMPATGVYMVQVGNHPAQKVVVVR